MDEVEITSNGNYFGQLSISSYVSQDGVETFVLKRGGIMIAALSGEQIDGIYKFKESKS